MTDDEIKRLLGGAAQTGFGMIGVNQAQKGQQTMLRELQGPNYGGFQSGAAGMLSQAANTNPQALAAQEYAKQQAVVAPSREKNMSDLLSMLRAKGMLGIANYQGASQGDSAVAGLPGQTGQSWQTTPGQAVNPFLASLLAANAGQDTAMAANALKTGQDVLSANVERATKLSGAANSAAQTGANVQPFGSPAKAKAAGRTSLLGNVSGMFGGAGGAGKGIFDALSTIFGSRRDPYAGDVATYGSRADLYQPDFSGGYY